MQPCTEECVSKIVGKNHTVALQKVFDQKIFHDQAFECVSW